MSENPTTGYSWQFDTHAAREFFTVTEVYEAPQFDAESPVGVAGIKKIFLKAATNKHGRSWFRAVNVRPWEFEKGFVNFNEKKYSEGNKVIFQIEVLNKKVPDVAVRRSDAVVEKAQAKAAASFDSAAKEATSEN